MKGLLIIDDNDGAQMHIKFLCNVLGIEKVFQAYTGDEGLEVWEANRWAIGLVFLDYHLPSPGSAYQTGEKVLDRLLEMDPGVQVFAMSDYYNEAQIAFAQKKLAGIFPKPISLELFEKLMKGYLVDDGRPPPEDG